MEVSFREWNGNVTLNACVTQCILSLEARGKRLFFGKFVYPRPQLVFLTVCLFVTFVVYYLTHLSSITHNAFNLLFLSCIFAASSSNTFTKTFGGIDGAGKRLAEEVSFYIPTMSFPLLVWVYQLISVSVPAVREQQVRQVVQKSKSLKKISFLAHSLGGLFARHAVGVLYSAAMLQVGDGSVSKSGNSHLLHGRIAGLEPINFITLATPHLGVRGRKQVLLFFSFQNWNQRVLVISRLT